MSTSKEIMGYAMFYPDGSKFGLFETLGGAKARFYQYSRRLHRNSPIWNKKYDESFGYLIKPLVLLNE